MKTILQTNPTFNPSAKTLNFSGVPNFVINRLLAVLDQTTNQIIYAQSASGSGLVSWNSGTSVLTLQKDTTTGGFASTDSLSCIYDDPAIPVTLVSTSTAGVTGRYQLGSSAASTAPIVVKSTAGTLFGIEISANKVDTGVGCFPAYLKIYNSAAPQIGVTIPILTICIVDSAGNTPWQVDLPSSGILCSTAISFAITANPADTDTTAPQAGHSINIQFI